MMRQKEGESSEVQERLAKAGYTGRGLFKKKALKELYAITAGTPRMINNICDGAMLLGYARQETTLGPEAIREVAHDLGLVGKDAVENPDSSRGRDATPKQRRRRLLRFRR